MRFGLSHTDMPDFELPAAFPAITVRECRDRIDTTAPASGIVSADKLRAPACDGCPRIWRRTDPRLSLMRGAIGIDVDIGGSQIRFKRVTRMVSTFELKSLRPGLSMKEEI